MMSTTNIALLMAAAYLIGSIPTGWLVARAHGVNILQHGSGNLGATNVGRVLGRKWGMLVLAMDMAKGAAATVSAGLLTGPLADAPADGLTRCMIWLGAGFACLLGNVFSIFLRFKGGKGVATSLGVVLGIYPYVTLPTLAALLVFGIVVKTTRYVSLGSLAAAGFLPVAFVIMGRLAGWPLSEQYPLLALLVLMVVVVFVRHRSNISRLLAGTENRIGERRDAQPQ